MPKYIFDPADYHILRVNNASVTLYGYTKEEFLQMTVLHLRKIEDNRKENYKTALQPYAQIGNHANIKARHYKKNGDLMEVELNSHTILLNGRKLILVTVNDNTEKEKIERKITEAIIKTQEDERQKLGAELHDNIGQLLAGTRLFLGMGIRADEPAEKAKQLAETLKCLDMIIKETRNISHRVYPAFLEEISFPEAIKSLLEGMNPDRSLVINFEYDTQVLTQFILPDMKLNIYRIIQEQLNNIKKYSKAGGISVELAIKKNRVYLRINDNGIGFDAEKIKPGIGLLNMKKRAELFYGKFLIEAIPGKGCTVTVEIPLLTESLA